MLNSGPRKVTVNVKCEQKQTVLAQKVQVLQANSSSLIWKLIFEIALAKKEKYPRSTVKQNAKEPPNVFVVTSAKLTERREREAE